MYPRLAISAPRSSERPKLGHDLRGIPSTDWSEPHLTQTTRDPELKPKLNFDVHSEWNASRNQLVYETCWFVKTLWILNDDCGAKPGHSSLTPATTEAMKVPWPKVSDRVLSEVQLMRSSGVFGKCG